MFTRLGFQAPGFLGQVVRHGFGLFCFGLALGARFALVGALPPVGFPFLTFFPAVVVTTLVAGLWPGVTVSFLSTLAAKYFFIPTVYSFVPGSVAEAIALGFFVAVVIVDVVVINLMTESLAATRQARARAVAAEATLAAVLEALPVGVIIADANGRITLDNAAHRELWGEPPDTPDWRAYGEWVGFHPDTGERIKAHEWALARALRKGEVVRDELVECARFGTGERRFYLNNAAPVRDADGRVVAGVVAELDVTERRRAEAALSASEARLRTIVETVPVGLVMAELPSGRIVGGNNYVETMLRHPVFCSADIHSYSEWVSFHADGRRVESHEYPLARMVLAGEENPSVEVHYERGDGTRAWTRIMGRPVRDDHGQIVGGVVALVDVDGERRAREALAESQARLELFIERAPAAIAMFDCDMRYLAMSRRFLADHHFPSDIAPASLVGISHYEHFPEIPPRWREAHARVLAGETLSADNDPFLRADGSMDWERWEMTPWRRADGTIGGAILFSEVVTSRVEADRRIAESEDRLRLALEAGGMGIWDWDYEGDMVAWDERQFGLFGRTPVPGRLHRSEVMAQVHPDDREGLEAAIAASIVEESRSFHHRFRICLPNGQERWIGAHGHGLRDAHGRVQRIVGLNYDITAERDAEFVLARDKADLERLIEERTTALRESEARLAQAAKMEALGRLAGGVAHDFNNVLQAVQGGISLAGRRMARDPEAASRFLGLAAEAAARGAAVTGRLLAFARRGELRAEKIVPSTLFEGLAEILRPTLGPSVCVSISGRCTGAPTFLADAAQLETVLINLANNARDAFAEGCGAMVFDASLVSSGADAPEGAGPGPYVRIAISDDGEGMAPDVLARVSEPFFTTKPKGQGTGLGLAMARGFVEQSGGWLTIRSVPGEGTEVALYFPAAEDAAGPEPVPANVAQADVGAGRPSASGYSVLLVDDEDDVRAVIAAGLSDAGHAVVEVPDARVALSRIASGMAIDVLVTDLAMPGGMNGLALVAEARQHRPGLPAVLVTGHAGEAGENALAAAASAGPFALLRKPADVGAIVAAIVALGARAAA